jgi:hypothetical protein
VANDPVVLTRKYEKKKLAMISFCFFCDQMETMTLFSTLHQLLVLFAEILVIPLGHQYIPSLFAKVLLCHALFGLG